MKVVSLSPGITDTLIKLGVKPAGVSSFCVPVAPCVGSVLKADKRALSKINPDIILLSTVIQRRLAEELEEEFSVVYFPVRRLSEVNDMIRRIAHLVGKKPFSLSFTSNSVSFKPRLYIEEWHKPPMAAGNWVPKLAELAGYRYPLREGELSREVDIEEYRPHIVVRSVCGIPMAPFISYSFSPLNVISASDYIFNSPGPRLEMGFEVLKLFHPENREKRTNTH